MNLKKMTLIKKSILLVSILGLSLAFTGCYSWFENKISMDTEMGRISLGDLLYQEPELTSLTAPTQVLVSQGKYSGTIKLHWDEVPYANSYRIERAIMEPDPTTGAYNVPDEGDFEVLSKYVYSNNFADTILAAPSSANKEYSNRYYYRVSAENIPKGLESSEFTEINAASCGWLLPPPASIEADKGENTDYIEVRWTAVPLANKYLVYRGERENGLGMELLDTVAGNRLKYKNTLYSNEKGVEFFYKVCAVLADGSQSAFTGLALGYSGKDGAPTAPNNIQITNGKGVSKKSFKVTWTPVSTTNSYNNVKYAVYRTSSVDSIYTLVRNNIECNGAIGELTDESLLKPGVKYYYYVQTIATSLMADSLGELLKSPFSKTGPDSTSPVVGWLLSPPSNCEVVDSEDTTSYTLRWTPAVGYEEVNYSYSIYSCDTLDGEYVEYFRGITPGVFVTLGDDGYYSYDVAKRPFYRIATVNDAEGLQSDMSITVAPCPAAPTNVKASKTSSLNGKISNYTPNSNGVYPVEITWSKPADENPYGYHVYRSTKPDSSFRKITDEPVTDGSFKFIDENEIARAGTFYYYRVVSLNILGQGKNANEQNADSRGYGALTREQWFREYNKTIMKSQSKLTLMHKSGSTDKLGSESINGDITGSLSYNASVQGLGGRVIMHYENYCDFWAGGSQEFGKYYVLTGNTNTTANMSANGMMDGTTTASTEGMYPGYAIYDNVEIKGGAAAGGFYYVSTKDKNGNTILAEQKVDWTVGED